MAQETPPNANNRHSPSMIRHRRESFWQIALPMLVVLLAAGGAFALIALAGPAGVSGVADLALIVVGVLLLLLGLIVVVIAAALVIGAGWLLRRVPPYTRTAQDFSARAAGFIDQAMQKVSNVVIPAVMGFSMVQQFFGGGKADEDSSQTD